MRKVVSTDSAPAAVGPYSQGIRVGDWLWVSGQIPLDPATGAMVEGGIVEQTARALENLAAVLAAGGGDPRRRGAHDGLPDRPSATSRR